MTTRCRRCQGPFRRSEAPAITRSAVCLQRLVDFKVQGKLQKIMTIVTIARVVVVVVVVVLVVVVVVVVVIKGLIIV